MRTHLNVIGQLVVLAALCCTSTSWSQQPNQTTYDLLPVENPATTVPHANQPPAIVLPDVDYAGATNVLGPATSITFAANGIQVNRKLDEITGKVSEIVNRLRSADELHKPAIIKELEAAVSEQFDEDMKNRDAELAKLEERVTKLRAQLERRRKAKAEITQLHTKVLVNDAEGLGFSDGRSGGTSAFRNSFSTGSGYGNTFYAPAQDLPSSAPIAPPLTAPRPATIPPR